MQFHGYLYCRGLILKCERKKYFFNLAGKIFNAYQHMGENICAAKICVVVRIFEEVKEVGSEAPMALHYIIHQESLS